MSAERIGPNPDILPFSNAKAENPEASFNSLGLNPSRQLATSFRGLEYFGREPDSKIDQFMELNRKKESLRLESRGFYYRWEIRY